MIKIVEYYKSRLLLMLLLLVSIAGCGKDGGGPTDSNSTGSIKGKITINVTGQPVVSASVSTSPQTVTVLTDTYGNFIINNISTGVYSVTASKSGYSSSSLNATVTTGDTATANIQLTIGSSIPAPPDLVYPQNNSVNQVIAPTLTWNQSAGAVSYKLQVSLNSSFTDLLVDKSGIQTNSNKVNTLAPSTKYWWRVCSVNIYGTSDYSYIWSFTTGDGSMGLPCTGIPSIIYEGKTYHTVQIGSQCWLKENLNIGVMILGSQDAADNGIIEKFCQNDDTVNCNTYGGLYQWYEAMKYNSTQGAQGICPAGWHIPTLAEFQLLALETGNDGNSLKEVGQGYDSGAGTNTRGFSALLGGSRNGGKRFALFNINAFFWSANLFGQYESYYFSLSESTSYIDLTYHGNEYGMSIRCLKNQ